MKVIYVLLMLFNINSRKQVELSSFSITHNQRTFLQFKINLQVPQAERWEQSACQCISHEKENVRLTFSGNFLVLCWHQEGNRRKARTLGSKTWQVQYACKQKGTLSLKGLAICCVKLYTGDHLYWCENWNSLSKIMKISSKPICTELCSDAIFSMRPRVFSADTNR